MATPRITGSVDAVFVVCAVVGITVLAEADIIDVRPVTYLGDSNPGDCGCSAFSAYRTLNVAVEEANALGGVRRERRGSIH